MPKTMYLTLDTETFGGASQPKGIYDIGGVIHDRDGVIVAPFNFIIAENYHEINADSYAKKNFPRYQDKITHTQVSVVATEQDAIMAIKNLCDFYNVRYVMAFNTGFDYCKTACRELLEGREFIDIYLMANQIFGLRPSYVNFCRANGLKSGSGKSIATSAQSYYAFLTNCPDYQEEHMALADSLIELEIFKRCIKAHKAYTKNCHFFDYPDRWDYITPFYPKKNT